MIWYYQSDANLAKCKLSKWLCLKILNNGGSPKKNQYSKWSFYLPGTTSFWFWLVSCKPPFKTYYNYYYFTLYYHYYWESGHLLHCDRHNLEASLKDHLSYKYQFYSKFKTSPNVLTESVDLALPFRLQTVNSSGLNYVTRGVCSISIVENTFCLSREGFPPQNKSIVLAVKQNTQSMQ